MVILWGGSGKHGKVREFSQFQQKSGKFVKTPPIIFYSNNLSAQNKINSPCKYFLVLKSLNQPTKILKYRTKKSGNFGRIKPGKPGKVRKNHFTSVVRNMMCQSVEMLFSSLSQYYRITCVTVNTILTSKLVNDVGCSFAHWKCSIYF